MVLSSGCMPGRVRREKSFNHTITCGNLRPAFFARQRDLYNVAGLLHLEGDSLVAVHGVGVAGDRIRSLHDDLAKCFLSLFHVTRKARRERRS